jgi:hypothetical protein
MMISAMLLDMPLLRVGRLSAGWSLLLASAFGSGLSGCGLRNVLPGPPVVVGAERQAYELFQPAAVSYTQPAPDGPVVLPLQVWGLRYALDVVLETEHPDWIMHEYARIDIPDPSSGAATPIWIAKDASTDFVQTITAGVTDIRSWVPEIPVPRNAGAVTVTDHSEGTVADLRFQYTNPRGEAVDAHYRGAMPTEPAKPRNGNTMGHSRPSLAALLDIHLYAPGGEAEVSIGGVPQKIRKLLGLYPMKFLLAQTQGGIAITDFIERAAADPGGFTLTRPGGDASWPTEAVESWVDAGAGWVVRSGPVTTLRYHFVAGELDRAEVNQAGLEFPVTRVVFQPAIPDLRRRFDGEARSRFVVDIAGQEGHGVGHVVARWEGDDAVLDMIPDGPRWFADRPMQTRIVAVPDGGVRVTTTRTQ